MNEFMKRAVQLAANNVRAGGQPFGAVLVDGDKIIAEGVNELHLKHDVSGHAELLAIRRAQEQLQRINLSGTTMYASGYPCPMCLTAMYFSGITDIYYCASLEDAAQVGLGGTAVIYNDLRNPNAGRSVVMKHIRLEEGMEDPMQLWQDSR